MKKIHFGLFALCTVMAMPSSADQVKPDDLIVQGNLCVGFDCVDGEDFSLGTLKLKENNTRLRWHDTSAVPGDLVRQALPNAYIEGTVGESWRMDANQSNNEGANAFYINQQSLETYDVLSDGTAPDYDCSDLNAIPKPVVGTIPEGEFLESEVTCDLLTAKQTLQINGIVLGGAAGDGVALGTGATLADGEVSLGSAELRRRLVHVASALADSDVLIKSQMDSGLFQEQHERLDEIEALLGMVERSVAVLETATKAKAGSGGSGAMGWLILLFPLLLALRPRQRRYAGLR
ncbi:hypothetical protein BKP64_15655 [Marinobacter salinus]|uniref:GlyGly-CTERM sorting domain-containing protein n=1 Tax=Marinobacter salinus TaxID=1874317 RepID=A0A1D9GPC9_9GAMM|nr:hypothetical protein [Marinobacter salinus]AOY89488.1 hypothetical protein BKP64_15655 [Marinobacter salinus]